MTAGDRSNNDDLVRLCYGSEDFRRRLRADSSATRAGCPRP